MTYRDLIYVALIVFVTVSVFITAVAWPHGAHPEWWILLVQLYGVTVFTYGWERADGRHGHRTGCRS
ncbi:hypothetical protein ABQF34_29335 [Mycolicibacterium boenickei]